MFSSVTIASYDSTWPDQFQKVRSTLQTYLKDIPIISIEHIGSTSVPNLPAKPILDIDIIVARSNVRRAIRALVSRGGYLDLGELGIKDRHALHAPDQSPARNVYVCVEGAFQTRNHLAVRETLRNDAALREEYAQVKMQLANRKGGISIDAYVEGKSAVLQKILRASGVLSEAEMEEVDNANRIAHGRITPIKTERLVLRELNMTDVDAYWRLESKEVVVRFQEYAPMDLEAARSAVARNIQASFMENRTLFELVVIFEGGFVGRVGGLVSNTGDGDAKLTAVEERGITGKDEQACMKHVNLWFSFEPEYWGRGFATEAMKAFIPLLGRPLQLEIECDPRNLGSANMARRLGFQLVRIEEDAFECKGERVGSMVFRKCV